MFADPSIVHTGADLRREAMLTEVASDSHATLGSARRMHPLAVGMLPPAEVARAVAFQLSHDARYLTGVVLDVVAGWNASWAA